MSLSGPPFGEFKLPAWITPYSLFSIGMQARTFAGAPASATWVTANQARYCDLWVPEPATVLKFATYNGATAAGNTDIGMFDVNWRKVASSGAVAQAGLNGWQELDITDVNIPPGLYRVGLLNTTTTGTYFCWSNKEYGRAAGVLSEAVGAGALPATATPAALDQARIPMWAVSLRLTV